MSRHHSCSLIAHIHKSHLTKEAIEWLETTGSDEYPIAVYPAQSGVFIHVDDLANLLDPIPEDMPDSIDDLVEFCQMQIGAKWVRIDSEGARLDGEELPTYSHE